jgi:hypothetical protein
MSTRPGIGTERSKDAGKFVIVPSAICQRPSSEMVFRKVWAWQHAPKASPNKTPYIKRGIMILTPSYAVLFSLGASNTAFSVGTPYF